MSNNSFVIVTSGKGRLVAMSQLVEPFRVFLTLDDEFKYDDEIVYEDPKEETYVGPGTTRGEPNDEPRFGYHSRFWSDYEPAINADCGSECDMCQIIIGGRDRVMRPKTTQTTDH